MKTKKHTFTFLFILLHLTVFSQYNYPEKGLVFIDTEVPRVDILIADELLEDILDPYNFQSYEELPATFIFTTSTTKDTMENIGFRLRGNSSRTSKKPSFKVSFNSFEAGRKFHGLEKLNLNGEHNDPSVIRAKVCWDLYNMAGVPSSRANHIALYINDVYRGLYINVEHIDEEFVDKRIGSKNGNLYKCLWPADMVYKGSDPDLYKEYIYDRQAYELKTNLAVNDYSDLAQLIDVLNNTTDTLFQCELEKIFDVDHFLKIIVLDVLVAHWDGPLVNKNNFYLYNDPCTGRFTFIPYDLDNTLGVSWWGEDWSRRTIYGWSWIAQESRPLYQKILAIPAYRKRYSFYFKEIVDSYFNSDFMNNYLDEKLAMIAPYRQNDNFAGQDYDWTYDDFLDSYEMDLEATYHIPIGLRPYIETRSETALQQLQILDIEPVIKDVKIDWSEEEIIFNINALDDNAISEVVFHYSIDGGTWISESLQVDAEGNASFTYPVDVVTPALMTYYVSTTDDVNQKRDYPLCQDATVQLGYLPSEKIVINEFMASNDASITDENGEYEDWIELYNAGNNGIRLENYYLSDDPDNPNKWQLPKTILYPSTYLVIWADDDKEQGPRHANFKLKKSGEFLGLFDTKANYYAPIDTLTYPAQETDISYARMPNGYGEFVAADYHTASLNNGTLLSVNGESLSAINIYPNPTTDFIYIDTADKSVFDVTLVDARGVVLLSQANTKELVVRQLPQGVYFLKIKNSTGYSIMKKIVKTE